MSIKNELAKKFQKITKNPHLHTQNHLLADELANKLHDKKHFGFYLKIAYTHDHAVLRRILGEVLENKRADTPGKLFTYLLKKHVNSLKEDSK